MADFKPYPKIHRISKEEVEGILIGECHVEEKIDGANTSIWMEDGEIMMASRSQRITEGFNGFVDYVKSNEAIVKLLTDHPEYRLYGEWLVRHSIQYNETAYRSFYLFDITVRGEYEVWLTKQDVIAIADAYGIPRPTYHGCFTDPTVEQLMPFVGVSSLGEKGEGIVIKNHEFRDKWGHKQYAKIVTENFKEENALVFGGNNKHSETYWEMFVVNKYMTLQRIEKIMHKLQPVVDERLDLKHTPRVIGTAYHDLITEEAWEIACKVGHLYFKKLKQLCGRKAAQIYKDIINNSISVADQK